MLIKWRQVQSEANVKGRDMEGRLIEAFEKARLNMPLYELGLKFESINHEESIDIIGHPNAQGQTQFLDVRPKYSEDALEKYRNLIIQLNKEDPVRSLNLSHQKDLLDIIESKDDLHFLFSDIYIPLKSLKELYLANCGLSSVPNMSSLRQLEVLDISHNNIQKIDWHHFHTNIRKILIHDNAVQDIDINEHVLPNLRELKCGSLDTYYYISSSIFEKRIDVIIPHKYRQKMRLPPQAVFDNNAELESYLKKPEKYLTCILSMQQRVEALNWLLKSQIQKVDLSFQDWVCDKIEEISWNSVESLNLQGCGLNKLPKLESIKELQIDQNPIEEIDFENDDLQNLKSLTCGSAQTRFISFRVLKRVANRKVTLCVPDAFRHNLLLPSWSTIQKGPDEISSFLDSDVLGPNTSHISSHENRWAAIQWQLEKGEIYFTSVQLQGNIEFCQYIGQENISFVLGHRSTQFVYEVHLSGCGLTLAPQWPLGGISTKHLKVLNLANNMIKRCPIDLPESLTEIYLEGNSIVHLNLQHDKLPRLRKLCFGSKESKFISMETSKLVASSTLALEIPEEYQNFLLLPSYRILKKNESLMKFIHNPICELQNTDQLTEERKDMIMWQVDQAEILTTLDLSRQVDLCRTMTNLSFLLKQRNLKSLKCVSFNLCKLSEFPDTKHLSSLKEMYIEDNNIHNIECEKLSESLEYISIAGNTIKSIPDLSSLPNMKKLILSRNKISSLITLDSKSLESLHIDDNPLSVLDFDVNKVPALIYVMFGSEVCQFVNYAILEKVAGGEMEVELNPHHASGLLMPPPDLFKNVQKLSKYIQCTQVDMSMFNTNNPEVQLECMKWLVKHQSVDTTIINLAGENLFCKFIDSTGLESLLSMFQGLTKLVLSNCGLSKTPHILTLTQLQKLDLKNNSIAKFPNNLPESLIEIDLQGNPIVGLHFEKVRLPKLKILRFGSIHNKYISEHIIKITTDGKLDLSLKRENALHLIFPPENRVKDVQSLKQFMDEASLDLSSIPQCDWEETLSWVQNYCPSILKDLKAYSMSKIDKKLHDLILYKITLTEFTNLKQLSIYGLGLQYLPDLSGLMNLTVLDCSKNKMDSVDLTKLPINSLRNLNISMNPILEFNDDLKFLEKLSKLQIGSPETKFICHSLLERALTQLELSVDEACQHSLLYPSYNTFTDKQKLRGFLEKRELNLTNIPCSEEQNLFDILDWLLRKDIVAFKSLSLANEEQGLYETNIRLSQIIYGRNSLRNLTKICVTHCGLNGIPDLLPLSKLKTVDLRSNTIRQINGNLLPRSVEEFSFEDNPIQFVKIDCEWLKEMKRITCGSRFTLYISLQLLLRMSEGHLKMIVPTEFQEHLVMPPCQVFEDRESLESYIKNPERSLLNIADNDKRLNALQWLVELDMPEQVHVIDLTSHTWLTLSHNDLQKVSLRNVQSLTLRNCALEQCPYFAEMYALKHLNLCANMLCKIPTITLPLLKKLDVTANPIEEIDFEVENLPGLKQLSFGSPITKYISRRVLSLITERNLSLTISEEYRKYLLLPTWNIIETKNIERYISSPLLCSNHISDQQSRMEAILWQLRKNEVKFLTLDLSNTEPVSLLPIFKCESLSFVTKLVLSNCGLDNIPDDWHMLNNLEFADLSNNNLLYLPKNSCLTKVDISQNKITSLFLNKRDFPKLVHVIAGSPYLEFISFELLKNIIVEIRDEYKNVVVMPPRIVLDTAEHLPKYLMTPDKYLFYVNDLKLQDAFIWLVKDADIEFTKLDLSQQRKLFGSFGSDASTFCRDSKNISKLQHLNISQCLLDRLPQLGHLKHLEKLIASENNITDTSTFEHVHLQEIDITANPVKKITFDFAHCPNLNSIFFGSNLNSVLSVTVLKRIVSHDLLVENNPDYHKYLMLPPPYISHNGFKKTDIIYYLESGDFNVSWFVTDTNLIEKEWLFEAISMDERDIQVFKMVKLSGFEQMVRNDLYEVLNHDNLRNIKQLIINECEMKCLPPLKQFSVLSLIDFSGNSFEQDICSIGDPFSKHYVQTLSVVIMNNVHLKMIPSFLELKHLQNLALNDNQLTSLVTLESNSLKTLTVTGNLFEVLDFDPAKVPSLSEVKFGSENCQFISRLILKKAATPQLKIKITNGKSAKLLIPLPHLLQNSEQLDEYLKCREISLDMFNTEIPQKQLDCILWLLENWHPEYETLNLAKGDDFCTSVGITKLEHIISKMPLIRNLILSDCSLTNVPDLKYSKQLQFLDLRGNNIDTFTNVCNDSVKEINVQGNPIMGFDLDNNTLPDLKYLKLGSKNTKFLSLSVLEKMVSMGLTLEWPKTLAFPPFHSNVSEFQIKTFVQNASLDLRTIPLHDRRSAYEWILEHSDSRLKSLSLSVLPGKDHESQIEGRALLDTYDLEKYRLVDLKHLHLRDIGLDFTPDLCGLDNLTEVDLGCNKILDLGNMKFPKKLQILHIEGNPMKNINISPVHLEGLQELYCGGTSNFCIDFPIIDRFARGFLKIHVTQLERLLLPPATLITPTERTLATRTECQRYLRSPETFISDLENTRKMLEALEWLFCDSRKDFKSINFSGMKWIFIMYEHDLSYLLDRIKMSSTLNMVRKIDVSSCNIINLQQLQYLTNVQELNVSCNQLTNISAVAFNELNYLNVSFNPIELIDINQECFPSLQSLFFGSDKTTFVSARVLNLHCEGKIQIHVSDTKRNILLSPPWEVIDHGRESILNWMKDNHFSVCQIEADDRKLKTLQLVERQRGKNYTSINLDGEVSLFQMHLPITEMQRLLLLPVFAKVTEASFRSCQLTDIDFLSVLKQLERLDISDNKIEKIPALKNLKKLIIIENDTMINRFKALDLNLSKCPKLKDIVAGSSILKFVNFSVVKAVNVDIVSPFKANIFPSVNYLMEDTQRQKYLASPEKFVDVHEQPEAFWWLLKNSDRGFETLDLSNRLVTSDLNVEPEFIAEVLTCQNVSHVETLSLEKCSITLLPNVECLLHLRFLNLDRNKILDISPLKSSSLESISITENPIQEILVTRANVPILKEIRCGSPSTKIIDFDILKLWVKKDLTVIVKQEYVGNIMIPPAEFLQNPRATEKYLNSTDFEVKYYADTLQSEHMSVEETFDFVLKREKRKITSFIMSGQSEIYSQIGLENLQKILSICTPCTGVYLDKCKLTNIPYLIQMNNLLTLNISGNELSLYPNILKDKLSTSLKYLYLRGCEIEELPLLNDNLEHLDVSGNKLKAITLHGCANGLKYLNVAKNPMPVLEIGPVKYFPVLSKIEFGSKSLRYVGFGLLHQIHDNTYKSLDKQEHLKMSEASPNLLFPPQSILEECTTKKYLDQPYTYLSKVEYSQRETVLLWLLANYKERFKKFSFYNAERPYSYDSVQYQKLLSEHDCLHYVTSLDLSNCNLKKCPDLMPLKKLSELNIEHNNIENINDIERYSIQKLYIAGNPLESVSLDMASLQIIKIGSKNTKFLGRKLLKSKLDTSLEIKVLDEQKAILKFPNYTTLSDSSKLQAFLAKPDLYLLGIKDDKDRKDAFFWSVRTNQYYFSELDLSGQGEMFREVPTETLNVLFSSDCFRKMKFFSARRCQLIKFPKLDVAVALKNLDLSENKLTSIEIFSVFCHLEELNIIGNPIERVELDIENLPQLCKLQCGSKETKYISIPILERAANNSLQLVISELCKNSLLLPSYEDVTSGKLSGFIVNPAEYAKQISDLKERTNIIVWLLGNRKDQTTVDLSGQEMMSDLLGKLHNESYLLKIHTLCLSKGPLPSVPYLQHLKNLHKLDISYNGMTHIHYDRLPLALQHLNIEGNPVKAIKMPENTLQSWENRDIITKIQCGSEHTRFISISVLKSQHVETEIITAKFKKVLLMPTFSTLNSGNLNDYIQHPDEYLKYIKKQRDLQDALEWLFLTESIIFKGSFTISNTACSEIALDKYVKNESFALVRAISFKNSGLFDLPSIFQLPNVTSHLVKLDISGNNIEHIPELRRFLLLENFKIQNNPMELIDFSLAAFPRLKKLKFGSLQTKYVMFSLLNDLVKQKVLLNVSEKARHLLFPPQAYIRKGLDELRKLCDTPEIAIDEILDVEQKIEFLDWLCEKKSEFKTFRIQNHPILLDPQLRINALPILSHWKLCSITELFLVECNIDELPDLRHFKILKLLDVRHNNITEFPNNFPLHESLQKLVLTRNPIETIDTNMAFFPALSKLSLGSKVTKFLGLSLLKRVIQDHSIGTTPDTKMSRLSISVPKSYESFLTIPPSILLRNENRKELQDFIRETEVDKVISKLSSQEEKIELS